MNRKVLILGGMVLVALALGACATPFECDDPLGCVDIAPDEPIHLSYMLPETGGAHRLENRGSCHGTAQIQNSQPFRDHSCKGF